MSVQKLSISFDADLAEAVREAAASAGGSLSSWLAEAAARSWHAPQVCGFTS